MSYATSTKGMVGSSAMMALGDSDSDSALDEIQMGLLSGGHEISDIVKAGSQGEVGSGIMGALFNLMTTGQHPSSPVTAKGGSGSSAGPALAAGLGGAAMGLAGGAAAFGKGTPKKLGVSPAPSSNPTPETPSAKSGMGGGKPSSMAEPNANVPPKPVAAPGNVKINLSPDAAKNLPVNPDNIDTSTGKVKVTPTATSITAIPVSEGETAKKGFEMIDYGGKKYWVSSADKNTYAAWNKAYATTGGLKPDDTTATPIETPAPTPKSAVVTPPPTPKVAVVTPTPKSAVVTPPPTPKTAAVTPTPTVTPTPPPPPPLAFKFECFYG